MAISFEGQIHYIKVYPGAEGRARFEAQIRELIQLEDGEDFDVEFECKAPDTGATLHLDGINAFDAATHCAALTAAERISKQQQQAAAQQVEQPAAAQAEPQQQAFDAAATQLPPGGAAVSCPGAAVGAGHM
ncbi:hypothetical protein COO60DRAFT_1638600 [Scenedesmus sp. NREL 46B-D3]|nr:hypothetical protein COO60DRAFT_1638600 [Scenedesmus sp. NREL 46B-D3]